MYYQLMVISNFNQAIALGKLLPLQLTLAKTHLNLSLVEQGHAMVSCIVFRVISLNRAIFEAISVGRGLAVYQRT